MSKEENSNIISKAFKNKDYLLEFIKKNDVKQFSVTEQETGAWNISYPKQYHPQTHSTGNEGA